MEESSFLHPAKALEAAHMTDGMLVADFGAGSGFFTRAAARAVSPTGVVWAVDINPDLLTRIKNISTAEGLHNVEIVRGNLESKNGSHLPQGKFDVVLATNILFSLDDKPAFAKEIARVLTDTGIALVIDWRDSYDGMGPHPDHVITIGAARDMFEKNGLLYTEDIPAGEFHWGFMLRKKVKKVEK